MKDIHKYKQLSDQIFKVRIIEIQGTVLIIEMCELIIRKSATRIVVLLWQEFPRIGILDQYVRDRMQQIE
ncbi:unnamed protein product [Paramecium primaurelia]|uniref:Uncharacterized protein n=1 Tax=Paramecium primaurelia TaxID=5886 RepID=A0A8S1N3H2_PARPR|nr:unnamed protein product [Paramecium primaurelia]